jgi:hypothetical protein
MPRAEKKTSALLIALAWIIVAIPLGWGVFQSVVKSLPLFQPSPAGAAPPAVPGGGEPRQNAPGRT